MNFTGLISVAVQKAGKQDVLATILDLSPSALSKRLNAENGWNEREINKLLEYTGYEICSLAEYTHQINTLKEAIKILLFSEKVNAARMQE